MKKSSAIVLICFMLMPFSRSQSIQDFESGFYSDWGTNRGTNQSVDNTFDIVDNLYKYGINTSNKVGKMIQYNSGDYIFGWFNFNPYTIPENITNYKYIHIMVLYELDVSTINNEKYSADEIMRIQDSLDIKFNVWKDYVYRINGTGTFSRIDFSPKNNQLITHDIGDVNIYVDEILISDDPVPRDQDSSAIETNIINVKLYINEKVLKLSNLNGMLDMTIFSLEGKNVMQQNIGGVNNQDVDLSFLTQGIYIVVLKQQNSISVHKVII